MSNKFRQKGPNKIMYPPKNGPRAVAKRLGLSTAQIPAHDPHDEITGNALHTQRVGVRYGQELAQLSSMGYTDTNRNLRHLLKLAQPIKDSAVVMSVIEQYLAHTDFAGIYIGDRVKRGPDWKWGDQDGGEGHEGTVRGLRQWHPNDASHTATSVVILWDHGLYANYRFGYNAAFDVSVVDRPMPIFGDEKEKEQGQGMASMISVGDRVTR